MPQLIPDFLADGGEMGRLIRAYNWSNTPLGEPANWPQSLRTTVRLMLNTNHPVFIFWGEDLTCFYNDAYRATLGPERHPSALGAKGRDVWDEIWPIIEPEIAQVMSGRGATWNEQKLIPITRHGKVDNIWWTYSYSPIDDESSASGIGGVLVVCTDVTAQHNANEELKQERERLMGLFKQAPGFIAVLYGPQHVFNIANDAYKQLVGGRDVIGLSVREALPELDGQGFYQLLDQVFSSGEPYIGQNVPIVLQSDAELPPETRYLSFIYQPIRDPNGTVEGIFVEGHDNTKSKLVEIQLRESLEKSQSIIENTKDLVCVLEASGHFSSVNNSSTILGYEPEKILGRHYADFLVHEDIELSQQVFANVLAGVPVKDFENRYLHKDGHIVHLLWSASWAADQKKLFAIGKDMTEWLKAEALARHAQRSQAIGQLTGGMAHDFNNLLTVILGNAESLTEQLARNSDAHLMASMIFEASRRGAELVQRLLAFARKQPLSPKPVDINQLLSGLRGLLARTLGENIHINLVCDENLDPAMVDESQLESAILNLCLNSRDAMPAGGKLTISAANSYLDHEYAKENFEVQPGHYIMIAVSDNGVGIAKEHMSRIFEPFFTTKEVGQGTGLGLSMVIGFIKQSKGHVSVSSDVGKGTVVKLFLPRADINQSRQRDIKPNATLQKSKQTILLVEDNELVREFAKMHLGLLGYQVVTAEDGHSALSILRQNANISLLFTDIVMPGGINGHDLAEQARKLYPAIKILLTSGYDDAAITQHGQLAAGIELLSKPYTRLALATKVQHVLRGSLL